MEESLKIGSLVKLRSDGPVMTVVKVGEAVGCTWFHEGELKSAEFPLDSLCEADSITPAMVRIKVWKGGVE